VLRKAHWGIVGLALAFHGSTALLGWEYFQAARRSVPESARSSPSAFRSYTGWYSGFRGGK
jgi:hypothetical protein